MPKTATIISAADHGRRMTLDEFDQALGRPGSLYELSRGVVTVVDVPGLRHLAQMATIRDQFVLYQAACPGQIHRVAGGGECKILVQELESERHPDVAVYKTAPPEDEDNVWAVWVPEIVVEVVSPGSEQRDYAEKPEEYLRFGISEYWVVDGAKGEMLVHRRVGGRWKKQVVRPEERYQTRLLPGFALDLVAAFAARQKQIDSVFRGLRMGCQFFRVGIQIVLRSDAHLHAHPAPALYALVAAAYGAATGLPEAVPDGFMLDAPEQCRIHPASSNRDPRQLVEHPLYRRALRRLVGQASED